MADLRLITILPQQPVQGVQQSQVTAGANPQGSGITTSLPPGTVLSGFIVNRDASGNPILRTDSGDVTFSSQFFLKIGSEVTIRIENTGGGTSAHILSVNGQPPEIAENLSSFTGAPDVIVGENLSSASAAQTDIAAPQQTTALTLTGTLISTPAAEAGNLPAAPSLPAGSQLSFQVTAVNVPPGTVAPQTAQAVTATNAALSPGSYAAYARASDTNATPTVAAPATTAPLAATPATPQTASPTTPPTAPTETTPPATVTPPAANNNTAEPLPASQPQTATPQEAPVTPQTPATPSTFSAPTATPFNSLPQQTAATPNALPSPANNIPLQQGQTITATVIGNEPSGEALVQTQAGIVRLQPGTVLPTGSTLTLNIQQITPPSQQTVTDTATALTAPAPLPTLARSWDSLQQLFTLLSGREALAGQDFVPANMPSMTPGSSALPQSNTPQQSIPSGLMLFMAALRGGDFTSWLGSTNVQWLRDQGQDALLKKVSSEFASIAKQFTDAPTQHWQPLFFPVVVNGEVQQARLFVKRDRSKKEGGEQQEKSSGDTRFVVEVNLSQLGEMQMDGFVRKRDVDTQFDLIIRSMNALPGDVQKDILQIYNDTGQITGYKGSLVFQNVRDFPVNPMEEIIAHAMNTVVA